MERQRRTRLNLYAPDGFGTEGSIELSGDAAHHARVRRVEAGDHVRLLDGRGQRADGMIQSLTKGTLSILIDTVVRDPRPSPVHVLVPVADRDRMLLAAEKCAELRVTSWQPVLWARSRSVSPRGEGDKFREKVIARMIAALEQSGGSWLPEVHGEATPAHALESVDPSAVRLLLDGAGAPVPAIAATVGVAIATGPEGGFEPEELTLATTLGWRPTSISASTLRFETAVIAAAAIVRAQQPHFGSV